MAHQQGSMQSSREHACSPAWQPGYEESCFCMRCLIPRFSDESIKSKGLFTVVHDVRESICSG